MATIPKTKLTKAEIAEQIADSTGMTQKDIHAVIDALFTGVKIALMEDRVIEFRGFGAFELKSRKGRKNARNPRTGQKVRVEDHCAVCFRPGAELKEGSWHLRR